MKLINSFKQYAFLWNVLILLSLFFGGWKKTVEISDFRDYYRASGLLKEKKDIYQFEEIKDLQKEFKPEDIFKPEVFEKLKSLQGNIASYIYPPTFAVMLIPISGMEYSAASSIFYLVNFACLLGTIYLLFRMSFTIQFSWVLFGALVFSYRFLENHVNNNQVAFILMFLSLLSTYTKKDAWSGFLLATAIIIKLTPAILVLYFLYEKRYKVLLFTFVSLIALSILPCVIDWNYGLKQWKNWYELVLLNAMKSPLFRAWKNNQSLVATLSKYFLVGADPINQSLVRMPYLTLEPNTVKSIFSILAISLLSPIIIQMKKHIGSIQLFSGLLVLSCILSGISWVHSFSVLLIPIFFLVIQWNDDEICKSRKIWIGITLVSILVTSRMLIGKTMEDLLLMFSVLLYISISMYFLFVYSPRED